MTQNFPYKYFLQDATPGILTNQETKQSNQLENDVRMNIKTAVFQEQLEEEQFSVEELEKINRSILGYIKERVVQQKFNTYFDNTFNISTISGNKITFTVTTHFIKQIITEHFSKEVQESVQNSLGKNFEIEVKVVESNKSLSSNNSVIFNTMKEKAQSAHQDLIQGFEKNKSVKDVKFTLGFSQEELTAKDVEPAPVLPEKNSPAIDISIDPNKTFDTFVVGPSNNMAFATAKAVAQNPGKSGKYPSLYFYSGSGLGKTHLLHAVANEIQHKYPSMRICLTTARDFLKEMISSVQKHTLGDFQKKYSEQTDILMIDDIHELAGKEGTQNEFFHIFNELHNRGKQLLFTSDKPPKDIDGIAERLRTRLQWGLVIDIQQPDFETRIAILKEKAEELDLFLTDDIFAMIASSIKTNIRELEGSLMKLSAYAEVMKVEIDAEMVKDILMLNDRIDRREMTLDSIAKATSNYYKIPLADIKSKARNKELADARHVAMYLSQKLIRATLKDIGQFYGGRDHTSVIHGIDKIQEQMKVDPQLSRDIINIENSL